MADLEKRTLGRTGLEVTVLGFGAMELRGEAGGRGRPITPEQAEAVLKAVLDAGINYIDTSIDYGLSEESIGRFISDRRGEYYLASKCGCLVTDKVTPAGERNPHDFSAENITAGVEQSLRRLRTDYLDLVQVHMNPERSVMEKEGVVDTLSKLQADGKVRFIGASSYEPNLSDHIAMGAFDVFQIPYSALQRENESAITKAADAGAGTVIRGGVARGGVRGNTEAWAVFERPEFKELLGSASPTEFLLRFTISHPSMSTTIVGTMNPAHLADNLAAAEKGRLEADVYAEAKRRLDAAGLTGA